MGKNEKLAGFLEAYDEYRQQMGLYPGKGASPNNRYNPFTRGLERFFLNNKPALSPEKFEKLKREIEKAGGKRKKRKKKKKVS